MSGDALKVGVVGLGVMGGGMAVALASGGGGREVNVFDVRPGAADALSPTAGSLKSCSSAREVAEASDVVITCVYSPSDAEAALLDPSVGVVAGLQPGAICIDTTTNTLDVIGRIEQACQDKGARFLASPVTGRPPRMTMMIGGDRGAFDEAREVLSDIGTKLVFLGTAQAACVAKHVNQYLTYASVLVASEGLVAAAKAGVPLAELADVLEGGSGNSFMLGFVLSEALEGREPPVVPAALRLVAKDVRLANETFSSMGFSSDVLGRINDSYASAEETIAGQPFPELLRKVAERYGVDPDAAFPKD